MLEGPHADHIPPRRNAVPGLPAKWQPRTLEDRLLLEYWNTRRGLMIAEVPIGGAGGAGRWPAGTERRRIDAVRLPASASEQGILHHDQRRATADLLASSGRIELIDVKRKLNRLVIGQVLAAQDMFERQYGIPSSRLTIVCEITGPGLEWVCRKRGIAVWSRDRQRAG